MSPIRSRRTLVSLALLATLLFVPSLASARPSAAPRSVSAVHAAASSGLLAHLWNTLTSLWGAEGMTIDPNGQHITGPSGGTTSFTSGSLPEGVSIDPNGQHLTNPSGGTTNLTTPLPEGSSIDPHG